MNVSSETMQRALRHALQRDHGFMDFCDGCKESKELLTLAVDSFDVMLSALKAMTSLMQTAADEIDTDTRHPLRGYGGKTVRENIYAANEAIKKAESGQ